MTNTLISISKTKPNNKITALFFTYAKPEIGGGHLLRCLTLANLMPKYNCIFLICHNTYKSIPSIKLGNHIKFIITNKPIKLIKIFNPNLLIIDSYIINNMTQLIIKRYVDIILCIDDIPIRRHYCDILIDSTYKRIAQQYKGLTNAKCKIFAGINNVILRKEFYLFQKQSLNNQQKTKENKIIVSMGLIDHMNATSIILNLISKSKYKNISVITGKNNPNLTQLKKLCAQHDYQLFIDPNNIAKLISQQTIAIGAGGTSSWERCYLGVPSIIINIADNQTEISQKLQQANAALSIGTIDKINYQLLINSIDKLIQNPKYRQEISKNAHKIYQNHNIKKLLQYINYKIKQTNRKRLH